MLAEAVPVMKEAASYFNMPAFFVVTACSLDYNGIGDAGVQAIAEGCKSCFELSEIR